MDRLLRALEKIEASLCESIGPADIAAAAALSQHHFCRYFKAMTGDSVMGYVWARRLSQSVPRLARGQDRLIDIAFDAGFDSQEAYTRAFKRRFGVTPGAVRRGGVWIDPTLIQGSLSEICLKARQESIEMEPNFTTLDGFKVTGFRKTFARNDPGEVPDLWKDLHERVDEIEDATDDNAFGVCLHPADGVPGSFDYLAGKKVRGDAPVPDGMSTVELPERRYAVFTFEPTGPDLPLEFRKAYSFIFENWLPGSGYRLAQAADFEFYEHGRFDAKTLSGEIDIYLPIEPAD